MIQNETPKVKFSFCQVLPCQLSREISHFTKFIDALDSCSSELFKKETDLSKLTKLGMWTSEHLTTSSIVPTWGLVSQRNRSEEDILVDMRMHLTVLCIWGAQVDLNQWLSAANRLRQAHYWEIMSEVGSWPPDGPGEVSNCLKFYSNGECFHSVSFSLSLSPFSSVQFSSVTQLYLTLCENTDCTMSGLPVHYQLLELTQTHVHWVSDAIQPSHPLLSPSPPALIFPSMRVFSNEPVLCIKWPKYLLWWCKYFASASASVLPMNIQDWFPLGMTGLISLQSKGLSSIFSSMTVQKLQFFILQPSFKVQHSHPYMTTGKTIALTRWTFVGKMMSLLLDMLSRFVIALIPGSKHLLVSWLQ